MPINRSIYFNFCEEKLNLLRLRIQTRGKLNILDFHIHSEDFYLYFFNLLFGYSLKNMNAVAQNAEAIDLIDSTAKIIVQVSSTATKQKIESTLAKKNLSSYSGYKFIFISIALDATDLRSKTYKNPHGLIFSPKDDIHDVPSILKFISHLDIASQKKLFEFLKAELGIETDNTKVESNLTELIKIIAKEDLATQFGGYQVTAFDVDEKIVFNSLSNASAIIEDHKVHHSRIEKIYQEFDRQGQNKSTSVLNTLRSEYVRLKKSYKNDELFFKIIEESIVKIRASANYVEMPIEELELSMGILAVDSFIRCKIFENPSKALNAIT